MPSTPDHPARAATLHDVARLADVSLITASRALRTPQVVSEKTRARVQEAVDATGYIPNLLAGGLKSRRSFVVAGLVPEISVAQFLPTVAALTTTLAQAGYQLMLGQTGYDHGREEPLVNAMIGRRPDGVVVTGLVHTAAARTRLARAGIPVVETWDLSGDPLDMLVGFSHEAVGAAIALHLYDCGRRQVAIATGNDHRAALRRRGFEQAWIRLTGASNASSNASSSALPVVWVPAPSNLGLGRRALVELLARQSGIDAVYCSSDQLAHGVLTEAQSRGLRVPEDLAICGFGDADFAAHTYPALTTVQIDGAGIGRRAAELVIARCDGANTRGTVVDTGFKVVRRETT